MSAPVPAPVPAPVATPAPSVMVIPADNRSRIKWFLDVDAQTCDNKDFASFLDQSRFTTVMKPGSCPAGMEVFKSPSAGSTENSSALPYIVCMPTGFDMSRSSMYHSYEANYIQCTIGSTGNILIQVIIWILVVLAIIGLGLAVKWWWFTHRAGIRFTPL